MHSFKRLNRNELNLENNLYSQRLLPWAQLNSPFEGSWCVINPGTASTEHDHHEHEIFIALKGNAWIECDGIRTPFDEGDIVQFAPHARHSVINRSDLPFEMYSIWWDKNMSEQFIKRHEQEKPSKQLVIAPPPTPNGDLHVGHMAGPYLAGDIYTRYMQMKKRQVNYATGTDDSQTYVVTSALKLGTTPENLCKQSAQDIKQTLNDWGIALNGFAPFDNGYKKTVYQFLQPLYDNKKFVLKKVKLPWSVERGEFMVESFVSGECPECLTTTRGGLCEGCGHPNNFDQLNNPVSTVSPYEALTYKETEILVFPVENYRHQLEEYYQQKQGKWRPHILQLMTELFSKDLIDFPVTYPIKWGLPSPFAGTEHQVLNAWVEGMPASMYCNACGEEDNLPTDHTWLATSGNTLAYFLGFDNSYFWGVAHLALLMAHDGKYILPDVIVPNEFYELENAKFSTSRGHLIWAKDLVKELPRDYARFYLCLTSPEHSRSNFSREALYKILNERLISPWNQFVNAYKAHAWDESNDVIPQETDVLVATMRNRLDLCCQLESYSQSRLAEWILTHIDRLNKLVSIGVGLNLTATNRQLQVLLEGMALILIDMCADVNNIHQQDPEKIFYLVELDLLHKLEKTKSYVS